MARGLPTSKAMSAIVQKADKMLRRDWHTPNGTGWVRPTPQRSSLSLHLPRNTTPSSQCAYAP
jgi:hypothetical protein